MYNHFTNKSDILTSSIKNFAKDFNISENLGKCGGKKAKGIPVMHVFFYLFDLIFRGMTLNRDQAKNLHADSKHKIKTDTCHRFLQSMATDWNKFLALISKRMMELLSPYRPKDCEGKSIPLMYVLDDSSFYRDRSKRVELLARNWDHALHRNFKGFRMLSMCITDGKTISPVAFCNMSSASKDNRINQARKIDDKHNDSFGARIRNTAQKPMTEALLELLDVGIKEGLQAEYVLCDRWFSSPKTIFSILNKDLHVITMLKNNKTGYMFRGKKSTLNNIFKVLVAEDRILRRKEHKNGGYTFKERGYMYSTEVEIISSDDHSITRTVKLIFVQNKNKKSEFLTLLSTDTTLSERQVIERFGSRWAIEVMFQTLKSFLNLQKTTQSIDYTEIHASTAIAMLQFQMLSYSKRLNSDEASYGELFLCLLEEVQDTAFLNMFEMLLLEFCNHLAEHCHLPLDVLLVQVDSFMKNLPEFIQRCLQKTA